jgi:hypothetical protein
MRYLLLAAAATFVLTGTAMADEPAQTNVKGAHHRHYRDARASVPEAAVPAENSAPADTLSAHDAYMRNLRDAGYNPSGDRDAAGNMRTN